MIVEVRNSLQLARSDQIDWSRAVVDSCSIRAVYGGDQTGPNPTDRAKRASKRQVNVNRPEASTRHAENRNESLDLTASGLMIRQPSAGAR